MSEETIQAPATEAPNAAPDTGGEAGARRPFGNRDNDVNPVAAGEPRFKGRRRRKVSYLTINKIDTVDFKDVGLLRRFINDRGKMLSTKATGNTAKQQRIVSAAIRRAREMALLPFVVTEFTHDSRPPRPPRRYDDRPYEPRGPRAPRDDDKG